MHRKRNITAMLCVHVDAHVCMCVWRRELAKGGPGHGRLFWSPVNIYV